MFGGSGVDAWNQGSAITRCEVTRARGNGVTVRGSTQTLIIDNFVHYNAGVGVQISSAFSSVVNNTITGNETGIVTEANDILIADNAVRANRRAGIRLAATSSETIVLRNIVAQNFQTGIDLDGGNRLICSNTLQNHTDLTEHENATNWVVPRGRALAAPISRYFRPPTIDDPPRRDDHERRGSHRRDDCVDDDRGRAGPVRRGAGRASGRRAGIASPG